MNGSWMKELRDWLKIVLIAVVIVLILHTFVFNLSKVVGHSMEPTLLEHEWLFVNKLPLRLGKLRAGNIVIVQEHHDITDSNSYIVKRIVGEPGDRIEIRSGKLYRNGTAVDEPYTDMPIEGFDYGPIVVEQDRYFIMGDNRHEGASRDSRAFGTVPRALIKGRAEFIMWPSAKWRILLKK